MDKVYKRINWNTRTCSGSIDTNKYLHSQIARAICETAYEKPLTIEEISLKTGIPTIYIEDELPRLLDGEAVVKDGGKYTTNFIILRLRDKKAMITKFAPLVEEIADYFTKSFSEHASEVAKMGFYGAEFGMSRLGYIVLPAVLRCKMCSIIDELNIDEGPYPPRLDGGYGWFLVDETETSDEFLDDTAIGSNNYGDDQLFLFYFWIGKYFNNDVYQKHGTRWLSDKEIIEKSENGTISNMSMNDLDRVALLQNNLIFKDGKSYKFNFPIFEKAEFRRFFDRFYDLDEKFEYKLKEIISYIYKSFKSFVPKRIDSHINVWAKCYSYNIIGFVAEELIKRGVLETPVEDIPLTYGVLCVKNKGDLQI